MKLGKSSWQKFFFKMLIIFYFGYFIMVIIYIVNLKLGFVERNIEL